MTRGSRCDTLSLADRATLLAAAIWGQPDARSFLDRFPVARRDAFRAAGECVGDLAPGEALAALRREHDAQRRPDLPRIDVSWWLRALKDEPGPVRLTVVANLPPDLAAPLLEEFGLIQEELVPKSTPARFAVETVMALWTERLVGDIDARDGDPLIITALANLRPRSIARLVRFLGLAKWVIAGQEPMVQGEQERRRVTRFIEAVREVDPRFRLVAERDLASLGPGPNRSESRLGLVTVARLLLQADPYRTRWALQNLPYATSKLIRKLMESEPRRTPNLVRWEGDLLATVVAILKEEGTLSEAELRARGDRREHR